MTPIELTLAAVLLLHIVYTHYSLNKLDKLLSDSMLKATLVLKIHNDHLVFIWDHLELEGKTGNSVNNTAEEKKDE
jgi:membrane-anchored protein YejM (alkaline phosphatase superfamily)